MLLRWVIPSSGPAMEHLGLMVRYCAFVVANCRLLNTFLKATQVLFEAIGLSQASCHSKGKVDRRLLTSRHSFGPFEVINLFKVN